MTAAVAPRQHSSRFLLVIIIAVIVFGVMYSVEHAVARHGAEAIEIKACSEGSDNLIEKWINPDNGRVYWLCDFFGQFALSIEEADGDFITAFVKNKLKKLEQVERYLSNGGAEKVW